MVSPQHMLVKEGFAASVKFTFELSLCSVSHDMALQVILVAAPANKNSYMKTCKQDMFEGKHLNIDFTSSHRLDTRPLPRRTLTAPCDLKGLTCCRTSGCIHHIGGF